MKPEDGLRFATGRPPDLEPMTALGHLLFKDRLTTRAFIGFGCSRFRPFRQPNPFNFSESSV